MPTNYIDPLYIDKYSEDASITFDSGTVTVSDAGVEYGTSVGIKATPTLQAIPIQSVAFRTTFAVAGFISADLTIQVTQNLNNFVYTMTDADLDSGEVSIALHEFFLEYTVSPLNPLDGDVFFKDIVVTTTFLFGEYVTWGPTGHDWYSYEVERSEGELTFHYLYFESGVWTSFIGTTEETL